MKTTKLRIWRQPAQQTPICNRSLGDLPYSAEQAAVIPNVIADMNAQDLAFTAHDGDLRQGSGSPSCSDGSIYTRATGYFASLFAPAIFTPGENDWTDCDRNSLGVEAVNSLQTLDKERSLFFRVGTIRTADRPV